MQPNIVLGVSGLVIAIVTGGYVGIHWEALTGLDHYVATFEVRHRDLPPRTATVNAGNDNREQFDVTSANITHLNVDLSWTDAFLMTPQTVALRVFDPRGQLRLESSHQGGSSGIHEQIPILDADLIPTGSHRFQARNGPAGARDAFDAAWPGHPETKGNWTFDVINRPAGSNAITYQLNADYDFYQGSWTKQEAATR